MKAQKQEIGDAMKRLDEVLNLLTERERGPVGMIVIEPGSSARALKRYRELARGMDRASFEELVRETEKMLNARSPFASLRADAASACVVEFVDWTRANDQLATAFVDMLTQTARARGIVIKGEE